MEIVWRDEEVISCCLDDRSADPTNGSTSDRTINLRR